jgi:hypothetical protein
LLPSFFLLSDGKGITDADVDDEWCQANAGPYGLYFFIFTGMLVVVSELIAF